MAVTVFPLSQFGLVIGIPVGLHRYADARGGMGKWWGTALGSVVGIGAGVASVFGSRKMKATPENIAATFLVVVAAITVGPILGYRASSDPDAEAAVTSLTFGLASLSTPFDEGR